MNAPLTLPSKLVLAIPLRSASTLPELVMSMVPLVPMVRYEVELIQNRIPLVTL